MKKLYIFHLTNFQADKPVLHVNEAQRGLQLFEGEYFININISIGINIASILILKEVYSCLKINIAPLHCLCNLSLSLQLNISSADVFWDHNHRFRHNDHQNN